MKFHESGLPNHSLVEKAFNYAHSYAMSHEKGALQSFTLQMNMSLQQQMRMLEEDKAAGVVPEDEYKKIKAQMEASFNMQIKQGPMIVRQELERRFVQSLVPAQEIVRHMPDPAPELLAAVLLVDTVRSPLDFRRIEKTFGNIVGNTIALVHHADIYMAERADVLAGADALTKSAYMALLVAKMGQMVEEAKHRAKFGDRMIFMPGQEEGLFEAVRSVWDAAAGLQSRMIESFNGATASLGSPYKMEMDEKGQPQLIKGAPPVPPGNRLTGPKKDKPNWGDEVF